jgi:hypothetical protein
MSCLEATHRSPKRLFPGFIQKWVLIRIVTLPLYKSCRILLTVFVLFPPKLYFVISSATGTAAMSDLPKILDFPIRPKNRSFKIQHCCNIRKFRTLIPPGFLLRSHIFHRRRRCVDLQCTTSNQFLQFLCFSLQYSVAVLHVAFTRLFGLSALRSTCVFTCSKEPTIDS